MTSDSGLKSGLPSKAVADPLGDRMKEAYENRARYMLPRRTNTVIRMDGKAFHSFTKGFPRPYCEKLMDAMAETMRHLCENISGAQFGYCQSDEISILLTDYATNQTQPWFGGNVQKMASVSAGMCSVAFNREFGSDNAVFDSRVFTVPDVTEVANYFVWRQRDAVRNSIQMAAQSMFSHRELHCKSTSDLQEMMFQKGTNWNDYIAAFKRGQMAQRDTVLKPVEYVDKCTGETVTTDPVERRVWNVGEADHFTAESLATIMWGRTPEYAA